MASPTRSVVLWLCTLVLAGCVSTPAPVVLPSDPSQPAEPISPAPVAAASASAHEPALASEPAWVSTIIQGSPIPSVSAMAPTPTPSAEPRPSERTPRSDLPDTFAHKVERLAKDACTSPKGVLADGWWVVMIGARAPESKHKEDWKHFGLLVDPVCFTPGPPVRITNPSGELNWLTLSKDIRLTCAEGMTPCAIGVFRRPLPPYPPSKIALGERHWPVAAIRVNAGEIDRVEEIVMPGDQPRPVATLPGVPGGPTGNLPGGQPAGTLGAGG